MDISLDSVLFWSGLGLLLVGLFVFLTGKSTADGKKKNNNRFEAFGIKVDVNNPSLVLIILGGVMMLAPIMMQQERAETTQYSPPPLEPVSQTEQALAEAPPPPTIAAPPQQTAPQARQKTTDKISPPAEPKPAKLESNKPLDEATASAISAHPNNHQARQKNSDTAPSLTLDRQRERTESEIQRRQTAGEHPTRHTGSSACTQDDAGAGPGRCQLRGRHP
ncbi:hypothetical protein [endosymbiont of Riftia pachyptila]|uniref:Uncharacterized protein n=1 Tax=endosymbiont of Riftia pachyptila (vent Ph05) TaxID=1048808 RepID=G2DBN2_9GAMM|nr:hypothetical protein [endosymbiont of Riftia pachyptila]EGV51954.1 hypothetical protein Rifp1Sym_at00070 [endosymbiont of Riftia pachyptila (vent Ph05)]